MSISPSSTSATTTTETTATATSTTPEFAGIAAGGSPPTHTTTKSGVKIPLLKSLSPEKTGTETQGMISPTVIVQSESGAPGPKPIPLPGMPGLPVSARASTRKEEDSLVVPTSPFKTPRRLPSPGRGSSPSIPGTRPPPSPRRKEVSTLPKADALQMLNSSAEEFEKTINLLSASLLSFRDEKSPQQPLLAQSTPAQAANSSSSASPTDMNTLEVSMPVVQIRRLSFRMKQPDQPETPRKKEWSAAAPSTADRMIRPVHNSATERPKVISEAAKAYSLALSENLFSKGKDIPTTIGRDDTKLPYSAMPGTLKPYYAKKSANSSQDSVPLAPLLRTLFKSQLESTSHWKKALLELASAGTLYDQSLSMDESNQDILENEKNKLSPAAEKIINILFPSSDSGKGTLRRLNSGIFSKNFLNDVIFKIDHEFVNNCKFNSSLSIKDINNLRCAILMDVMVSTFLEPLLLQKFPKVPSKSQLLMQSLLISNLKKAVNEMASDFLEKSQENMSADLKKFFQDKSIKEQKLAAEEEKRVKEEQRQTAMDRFSMLHGRGTKSTRDLQNFQKLRDARDRPSYFKHNRELFEKEIVKYGLDNVGESLGNFVGKEMRKWLDTYSRMQDVSEIRAELLASLKLYAHELEKSGGKPDATLQKAIDDLTLVVARDVQDGVARRIVAYDSNLLDQIASEPVSPRRTIDDAAVLDEDMMMTVTMGLDMPEVEDSSSDDEVAQTVAIAPIAANTEKTTTTTSTTSATTTTTTTATTTTTSTGFGGLAHNT